jgi:cell division protein FtsB
VSVVLFSATFPNHRRNCKLAAKMARLVHEKSALRVQNEHFRLEIEALRSDRFYIEAVARGKYKLVGPGEILIEPAETPESQ